MRTHVRAVSAIVVAVAVALITGCDHKTTEPVGGQASPYRPLTTPIAPIFDLGVAYQRHDAEAIATYKTLFDSEYRFNFTDVSEDPRQVGFFNYREEVGAAESLFAYAGLSALSLRLIANSNDTLSALSDTSHVGGAVRYRITGVSIDVKIGNVDYIANGECDFVVAPDSSTQPPSWRIIRWDDRTSVAASPSRQSAQAIRPTTWGHLKSLFEPAPYAGYRPLTTPVAPLWNIGVAYRANDRTAVDQYKTLFTSGYRFNFTDISQDPRHIGFFVYSEEVATAESLFTDPTVSSVTLAFLTNGPDTLDAAASDVLGDPPGTVRFEITGISLDVKKGDTDYAFAGGASEFYVAPDGGSATWRIVRWNDQTVSFPSPHGVRHAPNVSPTTWGTIKALYL